MRPVITEAMRKAGAAALLDPDNLSTPEYAAEAMYIAMYVASLDLPEPLTREEAIAEIATVDHA